MERHVLNIVIVEDDFIIAESIKSSLNLLGHRVLGSEDNAENALRSIQANPPHLVLVDVKIKGKMSGIELAERIREGFDLPVVFVTGFSDQDTLKLAKQTNPYGYLLKPITAERLKSTIEIAYNNYLYDKKIRESEKRYQGIVENLPFMLCRFSPENHRITFVNRYYSEFLRREEPDLIGESFYGTIPDSLKKRVEPSFSSLGADKPLEVFEHHNSEGKEDSWYRIYCQALSDNNRKVFEYQFIIENITDYKKLQMEILAVSDEERKAFGIELHDSLGQLFTGISFLVKKIQMITEGLSQNRINEIEELSQLVKTATKQCRLLSKGILPQVIEPDQFYDRLQELIQNISEIYQIKCLLEGSGEVLFGDSFRATQLFYMIRESLNNSIKHGSPSEIRINIRKNGSNTTITIEDNGSAGLPTGTDGQGIKIMKHRANLIGSDFSTETVKPTGFRVRLKINNAY